MVVVSTLTLAAACAATDAPDPGRFPEIRRITQTEATSGCIGDPRTPLCAVETFLACFERKDRSLCRAVSVEISSFVNSAFRATEYHLLKEYVIRAEDVPQRLKNAPWYQPGIVDMELNQRYCRREVPPCDGTEWNRYSFSVKQSGDTWVVVDWAAEGEEDFDDEDETP